MSLYQALKVYQNGGMIEFATIEDVLITSEPKGSVRIKRNGLTGFSFEQMINGVVIAYVGNLTDVRDENGDTYGATFNEVLNALSAFFELEPALIGANNGLSLDGVIAQLGGALIKDTTISGAFQLILSDLLAFRIITNIVQLGATTWLYFGSESTDGNYRLGLSSGAFVIQKRISTVWTTIHSTTGNLNEETYVEKREYVNTHITNRTTAFIVDLNSTVPVQVYAFPMTNQMQYRFKFTGLFRRTNTAGVGFFEVTAGANRSTALGSGVSAATPNVLVQENIAGASPGFTHAVQTISGVPNYVFFIDSNVATNTRYEVKVEIVETSIEDVF